jgi:DNA transformation protein
MGLSSFAQHAVDLLSGVGPVQVRAMFGGYGVSLNGISIGLIAKDRLYLRVDDESRAAFEAAGSAPFVYPSRKGPMTMKNYWALPEEAVDDPDKAERWGRLAVAAAERSKARTPAKKKGRSPSHTRVRRRLPRHRE